MRFGISMSRRGEGNLEVEAKMQDSSFDHEYKASPAHNKILALTKELPLPIVVQSARGWRIRPGALCRDVWCL